MNRAVFERVWMQARAAGEPVIGEIELAAAHVRERQRQVRAAHPELTPYEIGEFIRNEDQQRAIGQNR